MKDSQIIIMSQRLPPFEERVFLVVSILANFMGFACGFSYLEKTKHVISVEAANYGIVSLVMHIIGFTTIGIICFQHYCGNTK